MQQDQAELHCELSRWEQVITSGRVYGGDGRVGGMNRLSSLYLKSLSWPKQRNALILEATSNHSVVVRTLMRCIYS